MVLDGDGDLRCSMWAESTIMCFIGDELLDCLLVGDYDDPVLYFFVVGDGDLLFFLVDDFGSYTFFS